MEGETKKWYKSKTVWFNAISAAIVFTDGLATLLTGLIKVIPPDMYPWVLFAIACTNLFLRALTSQGIEK